MNTKVRVLAADDTVTFRSILKDIIDGFSNAECIATAPNGKIAVRKVKDEKPDLVILDVEMPEMDGPEALKAIREFDGEVPVIMLSGFNMENARKVITALAKGALDFITKPVSSSPDEAKALLAAKLKPLIDMVEVRKIVKGTRDTRAGEAAVARGAPVPSAGAPPAGEKPGAPVPPASAPPIGEEPGPLRVTAVRSDTGKSLLPHRIDLVLIALSTGGPNALRVVIPTLHRDLDCPVLVVQHMPAVFTKSLAESLNNLTSLKVAEGADGIVPGPGEIYIAPGGRHMILHHAYHEMKVKNEIRIVDTPPVNSCRPAADVLFRSVARVMEKNILTVVMTGMGNDGTAGVEALKQKGAYCLVQDEKTSVVWGMPQEVYNKGLADEVLPLEQIGPRISQIVMRGN